MIQGVTAVVTASIPVVDETANYKALVECAFILNGAYLSILEYSIILGFFLVDEYTRFLFDPTGLWNRIYGRKVGTDASSYL